MLDLRTDAGRDTFLELVRDADAVVEAMRPGGLERRGLGFEALRTVNPRIVFVTISGYGATGPYRDMPSHGIAYDVWAGIVQPKVDDDGYAYMPEHVSIGINAGPVFGALGLLAGVLRARETGEGCQLEIAQSDAAAAIDWLRSETWKAYERPESEVTGNAADNYERRAPGHRGHGSGRPLPVLRDHRRLHALHGVGARVLEELLRRRRPARSLRALARLASTAITRAATPSCARSCARSSRRRSSAEWLAFGMEHNTPIAPSNTPKTHRRRSAVPAIACRGSPPSQVGADMLPTPIKFVDETLPLPTMAPTVGEHTEQVLRDVLGWDDARIAAARDAGAFGKPAD